MLTICIIGLGSIGQRHLRNLAFVAKERRLEIAVDVVEPRELDGLDVATRALVRNHFRASDAIGDYDLIWVANPSQLHYETLKLVRDKARRFLVEKPVFTRALTDGELAPFADEAKFYVACPIRHTRSYHWLEEFVRTHRIYCAKAMCSSYLPAWRPGTDYRKTYAAQPGSGGVKLDLVHEFDYLFTLFGMPTASTLLEGKVSHLEIASSDVVSFVAKYPDKTLELHLDYFGRVPRRTIELFTEDDVVVCDFIAGEVRFLKSGERIDLSETRDDHCRRETAYFLDFALDGRANINSIPYANAIIRFLMASSRGGDISRTTSTRFCSIRST